MTTSPKIRGAILGGTYVGNRGDTLPPYAEPSRECISPSRGPWALWALAPLALAVSMNAQGSLGPGPMVPHPEGRNVSLT